MRLGGVEPMVINCTVAEKCHQPEVCSGTAQTCMWTLYRSWGHPLIRDRHWKHIEKGKELQNKGPEAVTQCITRIPAVLFTEMFWNFSIYHLCTTVHRKTSGREKESGQIWLYKFVFMLWKHKVIERKNGHKANISDRISLCLKTELSLIQSSSVCTQRKEINNLPVCLVTCHFLMSPSICWESQQGPNMAVWELCKKTGRDRAAMRKKGERPANCMMPVSQYTPG